MRRVFVTGGSGFVGRALLAELRARGIATVALARSDAAAATCAALGAEIARGDLDDRARLQAQMAGCDTVIHAAAHVKEWDRLAEFHRINVLGTENVLAAAAAAGATRLVHISTEAVLCGGQPVRMVDETCPYAQKPLSMYAASKAEAERRVLAALGLDPVVVRPRLVWGRGDTSVLPQLAAAVRAGRFRWIGDGRQRTSTCHVRNVAHGALLAAERGRPREIYFLTDGPPVELRWFLRELLATQGLDPGDRRVPLALARAAASACEALWRLLGRTDPPPVSRGAIAAFGTEVTVDDSKARRDLGYTSPVSLAEGLAEMRAA
ncbi:MAG TPA: NAD-dependent epimerase/dehydratase family protein [Nannocystis sp.]